jgi:tight adherence protein B
VLAIALIAAGMLCLGAFPTCAGAGAWICLRAVRRRAARRRNRAANAVAVPAICRIVAAELAAGAAPVRALSVAATSAPAALAVVLREAAAAERLGTSASDPLARAPAAAESLRYISVCWALSSRTGSRLGPALERVGAALQSEIDSTTAVDAELVGPRLSGRLMSVLPLFGVLLGAALGTNPLRFLFATPLGAVCLVSAALLDLLGLFWISRLARAAAR